MNDMTNTPAIIAEAGFNSDAGFALLQRGAKLLSASSLVPEVYRDNIANCTVALNMAQRMNADPLMVMQNLYVVHGRPAWSAQFLIACFNQCGRFSAIRYRWQGTPGGDEWGCRAWAVERDGNREIVGPLVTLSTAKEEGWLNRTGSKWKTIPELMITYRAAAWMVRTHAPELAMGLPTAEELHDTVIDITPEPAEREQPAPASSIDKAKEAIAATMGGPMGIAGPNDPKGGPVGEPFRQHEIVTETGPTDLAGSAVSFAAIAERIVKAKALDELDVAGDLIRTIPDEQQRAELDVEYRAARKRLQK